MLGLSVLSAFSGLFFVDSVLSRCNTHTHRHELIVADRVNPDG